jgi:peptidoglycan L-alanyl-D-glutamate endopeptidase CwlK
MSLSQEQAAFLLDMCKLIRYATEIHAFMVTGGELARTPEQQAIYVKTGRSKTMNSIHLKRCAVDLNFFRDRKIIWDKDTLAPIGAYWESLNKANSWGGNGVKLLDTPHFSRNPDGKPEFRRVTD